jgi:ketosteroid isomerase-like protein
MNWTAEQNKQAVVNAWKTFGSRDPALIANAFTEDAEWIAPAGNATAIALEFTDHMVGRDQIVEFLCEKFHTLFVKDIAVEFLGLFCDGQTVILEERMQATLVNGRHYDNTYCFFFELRDGKIARIREYMDTLKGSDCIFG